jgi:hypothetical protein
MLDVSRKENNMADIFGRALKEGVDYVLDPKGFRIMSGEYLKERGYCCGTGCPNCPYDPPQAFRGNEELQDKYKDDDDRYW